MCGQEVNKIIKEGNDAYAKGDFTKAAEDYQKALEKDPKNDAAKFNLGNALQKQNQSADAVKQYDDLAANSADKDLQAKAYYNKGVSFAKEKKLPGAIDAFKQSLLILPSDDSARENLQKAINDLKQQQQKQQQKQNKNQNNQQQKQQPQSQPQNKNSLSKQRAEQLLSALREQEKELQKKLQQQKTSVAQPDKDW